MCSQRPLAAVWDRGVTGAETCRLWRFAAVLLIKLSNIGASIGY